MNLVYNHKLLFNFNNRFITVSINQLAPLPNPSYTSKIHVYYQNAGSIHKKFLTLQQAITCYNYDIIMLTENWLISYYKDGSYLLQTLMYFVPTEKLLAQLRNMVM